MKYQQQKKMTCHSKMRYETSEDSIFRINFLADRIIRQTLAYEENRNYHTYEALQFDIDEKQKLSEHYFKQLNHEGKNN